MQRRLTLVFSVSLTVLILGGLNTFAGRHIEARRGMVGSCNPPDEVAKVVISLSREYGEAQTAQRRLRQWSKQSSACRERVIAAVIGAMDKPNLDISRDQASANLWREGARLLGDLKAVQSLDLLLLHITMTDGEWSVTMTHQPALDGIIRMGPVAVPKTVRLLQSKDAKTRHYAVYCLASIGGASARAALQQAFPKEADACVKGFIHASIKRIDGFKDDAGQWLTAFLCQTQLRDVKITAESIGQFFTDLSLRYDIPVGLEIGSNDDKSRTYAIDFKRGSLSQLLSEFFSKHEDYTWEINDGVVNVFPKHEHRDLIVKELLTTEIEHFSVKKNTSCGTASDSLARTPEMGKALEATGQTFSSGHLTGFYIPQMGRHYTLEVSRMTLNEILNKMVKESPTAKIWVVERYSSHQILLIRLNARFEDAPVNQLAP